MNTHPHANAANANGVLWWIWIWIRPLIFKYPGFVANIGSVNAGNPAVFHLFRNGCSNDANFAATTNLRRAQLALTALLSVNDLLVQSLFAWPAFFLFGYYFKTSDAWDKAFDLAVFGRLAFAPRYFDNHPFCLKSGDGTFLRREFPGLPLSPLSGVGDVWGSRWNGYLAQKRAWAILRGGRSLGTLR